MVLWEEYREVHPDGWPTTRFCDLFREFERRLLAGNASASRGEHDKVFVDYSGKKVPIVDPDTGVVREAEIFVAVLGAEPHLRRGHLGQALPDWIGAHVRLFRFLGGVPPHRARQPEERDPQGLVLRPEINRSYGMMAAHYGVGVLPARPRKPRDKAQGRGEGPASPRPTSSAGCDGRRSSRSPRPTPRSPSAMERINAHVMHRLGVSRRER